jgi:hypothetical protein
MTITMCLQLEITPSISAYKSSMYFYVDTVTNLIRAIYYKSYVIRNFRCYIF